jgi:hypothetical protein
MEWLAAAIALVAAGATFWQASEARAARKEARAASEEARVSRDAAAAHEAGALTALESIGTSASRTADAAEGMDQSGEKSAKALEEIATRQPPWSVDALNFKNGLWKLSNVSAHTVVTTKVVGFSEKDAKWLRCPEWMPNVEKAWTPGDWERVNNEGKGMAVGETSITIAVYWNWADEPTEAPPKMWKGLLG